MKEKQETESEDNGQQAQMREETTVDKSRKKMHNKIVPQCSFSYLTGLHVTASP